MKKKETARVAITPTAPVDNNYIRKDTHFRRQIKIVFKSFSIRPKTMLEVAKETGIERANVCRYVARLRRRGRIELVRRGICPISRYRAGFWRACAWTQPRAVGEIMRELPAVCPRTGEVSLSNIISMKGGKNGK